MSCTEALINAYASEANVLITLKRKDSIIVSSLIGTFWWISGLIVIVSGIRYLSDGLINLCASYVNNKKTSKQNVKCEIKI